MSGSAAGGQSSVVTAAGLAPESNVLSIQMIFIGMCPQVTDGSFHFENLCGQLFHPAQGIANRNNGISSVEEVESRIQFVLALIAKIPTASMNIHDNREGSFSLIRKIDIKLSAIEPFIIRKIKILAANVFCLCRNGDTHLIDKSHNNLPLSVKSRQESCAGVQDHDYCKSN